MSISLLREALSVPEIVGKDDILDPQSIIRERSIEKLCRSFIRKSNDGCRYEFAHFSVQEFLESEMMSIPRFEIFKVSESICQLLLAKQCLRYLVFRDFSYLPTEKQEFQEYLNTRIERYPFYFYSAVCWPIFAKAHWADESLLELVKFLFQPEKTGNFVSWALELTSYVAYQLRNHWRGRQCYYVKHPKLDGEYIRRALQLLPRLSDRKFTTLHMAAALSLTTISSSLIDQGACIDQRSSFGSPLQCAVQGLFLSNDYSSDGGNLPGIFLYSTYFYWQGQDGVSELDTEKSISLLLRSGANRVTACSSPFEGQALITVALRVALGRRSVRPAAALLGAGSHLEEDDLKQFTELGKGLLEHSKNDFGEPQNYHLESLILSLSPKIDTSAAHFRLCQAAWSLAIEMGSEFARDPYIVDTRISLSQEALSKIILTSALNADTETLIEALKDPRADVRGLSDHHDRTLFEIWLRNLSRVDHWESLTVIRMLFSAEMEVNQPNHNGLLPIHQLASRPIDKWALPDDDEALCDIVREFMRRGTGCDARSRNNRNVFHFGSESLCFIKAVLKTETEEDVLTALGTRDDQGRLPITFALQAGEEELGLLLLERMICNPKTLSNLTSVYAHCVTGGAHRAFNLLLSAGVKLEPPDAGNKTLLHYVGPRTGEKFILQLIRMFPDGLRCRIDDKIPLDNYFESCIGSQHPPLDGNVVQLLAGCGSGELDQGQRKSTWKKFILCTQNSSHLRFGVSHREDFTTKAIDSLLQQGFVASYEANSQVKWILQLLKPLRGHLGDLWPVSRETIRRVLEYTTLWELLRGSAAILRLLKIAVCSDDIKLVEVLLNNGVSVHQRIDEMSALEMACLHQVSNLVARQVFTLLLDHSEPSRINEINPHNGQERGLLHYLTGLNKQWQLEELLKRDVDINLRTSFHVDREPAVVHYLWESSPESAMILLDHGANPAMADSDGRDTALIAAVQGNLQILLRIHATSQKWQLNWERTCDFLVTDMRDLNISGANALHLAAQNGYCDVLRFYLDEGLLTDVNTATIELFTPLHLAAFRGQLDTIKFLCSRGGRLNLKAADGSLPLHLAVRNNHPEVVEFLVENDSAMDADMYGVTPVGYAMQLQNQSILHCLHTTKQYLDYRSQPRRRERELVYAYEQALIRGNVEECERLLGQGCLVNVELPGQHGRSALGLAIEDSKKELVKWLLGHDAEITKQDLMEDGDVKSPLQAMIMQPSLNDVLLLSLQKYEDEGGSVASELPILICVAVQYDNTPGLEMLLDHVARSEHTNS